MQIRASLGLFAVLLLVGSCAPPPQTSLAPATSPPGPVPTSVATVEPGPAGPTVEATFPAGATPEQSAAGNWQTHTNTEAGFSIRYPPGWSLTQSAPSTPEPIQVDAVEGPEGRVELMWGTGFGGACAAYSALHMAQGQLPACHTVGPDGTQQWQFYKPLPATTFGGRAFTKDANTASADVVLAVLATLTFEAAPVPTPSPGQTGEIVVDNADVSFWPRGNWYFLDTPQKYGQDCYVALRGLDATAQVRPDLPAAGSYEVFARWCGDPHHNQTGNGIIEVHRSADDSAPQAVAVNYQANAGQWQSLGTYNLQPGAFLNVKSGLDGNVVADAFRFVSRPSPGDEVAPTPLPTGPLVSNHPPSPLQQLTSGDLAARLALNDPFYLSAPMTSTEGSFDDCQAFPRDGCGGTRAGWQAIVAYETITLTYHVSDDYKLVAVEGADMWLDPWLMGQDHPQRLFLRGSGGGMNFSAYYYPDNTWHLLRPGDGSTPDSDVTLTQDQAATLHTLAPKYSTLYLQPAGGGTLVFYGLGPVVAPSDEDRETLLALGAALAAAPR